VLTEHGIKIAPSTYYARVKAPVSAAEMADAYAANVLVDLYRVRPGSTRCASCGTPAAAPGIPGAVTRSVG
jgi:hypothetical protein